MAIAGALIGGAIGAYGKKPKVPKWEDIDPGKVQLDTIKGNVASLADVAKLAAGVDTFNQDQLEKLIDRVLPGAREQIESNIGAQLRGELPEGVLKQLQRTNAERSVGALAQGSQFALGRELGSQLGMSLALTQQGLSSAESWLARASAPSFDVTTMFFTPQQRLAFQQQQQASKFQRDMIAAGVKAAPDPKTAALGQEIDRFFNTVAGFGMMAAGGAMGGGMGAGGGAGGSPGAMAGANQSIGVANPYNIGGYGLQGSSGFNTNSFGGGFGGGGGGGTIGSANGQAVGIGQSNMGGFYQNWASKYGW